VTGNLENFAFWSELNKAQVYHSSSAAVSLPLTRDLFHLHPTNEASSQFLQLTNFFQNLQLQLVNDTWTYIWGSSAFFQFSL
jgi:hypothetical protein